MAQTDTLSESDRLQPIMLSEEKLAYPVSPFLSAILVGKGEWEINQITTLQTRETEVVQSQLNPNVVRVDTVTLVSRTTNLDHTLQLQVGVSKNYRFNVGVDLYVSQYRNDEDVNRSALKILSSGDDQAVVLRGVSAIGPRIRWIPFKNIPELNVQASAVFGLGDDLLKKVVFGTDRTQLQGQVVYVWTINRRLDAVVQGAGSVLLPGDFNNDETYGFNFFGYLSAQLTGMAYNDFPKLFAFGSWAYQSVYDTEEGEDWKNVLNLSQVGLGLSLQFNPQFSLFLLGQTTLAENTAKPPIAEIFSVTENNWNLLTLGFRVYFPKSR